MPVVNGLFEASVMFM